MNTPTMTDAERLERIRGIVVRVLSAGVETPEIIGYAGHSALKLIYDITVEHEQ